jgi:cysteine sulfinate desulfinase/cysteine desulfurase-like protein
MIIKGAKTIEEYRQMQHEQIQNWIDRTFVENSVTWKMEGALNIRVTDKTGDSMVIALQDIN